MNRDHRQRFFRTARSRATLRQGRTDWYSIDLAGGGDGSATIRIYDEIGWFGVTAEALAEEISQLDVAELEVRLDTPGGSAFDGIAIYNELREHPARVTTKVYGMAASAGSVILMAGEERWALPNTMVMVHDAMGVAIGQARDLRDMADLLDKLSGTTAQLYADTTGLGTPESWRKLMTPSDSWFTPDEAHTAGLVTHLADTDSEEKDEDLNVSASWDLSIFTHASRAEAQAPDLSLLLAPSRDESDPVPTPGPVGVESVPARVDPTPTPLSPMNRYEYRSRFLTAFRP